MSRAPLSLERYFYTRIHIEANREFTDKDARKGAIDLDVNVRVSVLKNKDDPELYQLVLATNRLDAKEGPLPYLIDAEVVGVFRLDPAFKHNDRETLVRNNGASMLYGALREYLLMLTGRGPWGEFQLPTISFLHPAEPKESKG